MYYTDCDEIWQGSDCNYLPGMAMAYASPEEDERSLWDEMEGYLFLNIEEWEGKDCVDWANGVCRKLNIDGNIVNLWAFSNMSGLHLLSMSYQDFCNTVGTVYGQSFYTEFTEIKQRKERERMQLPLPEPQEPFGAYGVQAGPFGHVQGDQLRDAVEPLAYLEPVVRDPRGRPRGPRVWEFLVRLLIDPQANPSLITWEDETSGTFRLVQKERIAAMWSRRSRNGDLSYNNFARTIRHHYNTGALEPVMERQLVYRLGQEARQYLESLRNQQR